MVHHNAVRMTGSQLRSACRIPPLIADPIAVRKNNFNMEWKSTTENNKYQIMQINLKVK